MPDDLKKIRERKGMTIGQLASRAGLSAQLIAEYETGKPIPAFDRARLAKALYVDERDMLSQPPATRPAPSQKPGALHRPPGTEAPAAPPKPAAPARPGQIAHLQQLLQRLSISPEQAEAAIGKSFDELTLLEARQWLTHYEEEVKRADTIHPPGYRSRRAFLPEAVDEFEMKYLAQAQAAGATLTVKMFNGEVFTGALIGFGTYTLTLRAPDGGEVTLHKLAIAYYRLEPAGGAT